MALHKGAYHGLQRQRRRRGVETQPGAIGAGQLELDRGRSLGPGRDGRHFDKAHSEGRPCRGCRVPGRRLFFEVGQA
jgi:hypothetical protein